MCAAMVSLKAARLTFSLGEGSAGAGGGTPPAATARLSSNETIVQILLRPSPPHTTPLLLDNPSRVRTRGLCSSCRNCPNTAKTFPAASPPLPAGLEHLSTEQKRAEPRL